MRHRAQPPAIWIIIELESDPRVRVDADTEAAFERLLDWIDAQPESRELLARALLSRDELRRRWQEGRE